MPMSPDQEFWIAFTKWGAFVFITLILSVLTWNVVDRIGPIRPNVHLEYAWPSGTPSK